MLSARLILAPIFIAALVALCWLDANAARPGVYLLPLAVLLSVLSASELLAMIRKREAGERPLPWVVYIGTLTAVLAAGVPALWPDSIDIAAPVGQLGWLAVGIAAGLLLAIVAEMRRFESPGQATTNLALTVFAILYCGGLMGFLVQLRLLGLHTPGNGARLGLLALASLVLVVKMSDIGQYTAGRLFGKHKLAPRVSPGKTWEGVAGGMLFAVVGGFLATWLAHWIGALAGYGPPEKTFAHALLSIVVCPLLIAAFGIVGDLAESLLKRDAGVKDSSTWMPGFGGVLDLLDSLLGAAPVAYLLWALHIVGP